MPEPFDTEVLRQLAAVRRELRLVRALLIFVSLLLAVVFLLPLLGSLLAAQDSRIPGFVAPVLGVVVAVAIALFVASRYAPTRPTLPADAAGKPAA